MNIVKITYNDGRELEVKYGEYLENIDTYNKQPHTKKYYVKEDV